MGSEDEEEIYGDGEEERKTVNNQMKFIYTEEGEMVSVGTLGNAPAAEFEDSSIWEYAKNDVISGMNVNENDDKFLYKGRTFETKSELQSVIRAYSVKNHREIVVTNSNKTRYIVVCKLKDEGSRGCSWRLHASINLRNKSWEIKTFRQLHVCINQTPRKDHKQLTSALVGGLIIDMIKADLCVKPVIIIEAVKLEVGYTISY